MRADTPTPTEPDDIPAPAALGNGDDVLSSGAPDGAPDEDIMAQAMGDELYDEPSEEDARLIELVGFLVQGIVAHPDEVEVEEFLDDVGSVYGVRVHPDDVGRVIGREGRVANALRHVVKAAAVKSGARVAIEIITEDTPLEIVDSDDQNGGANAAQNGAGGGQSSGNGSL